MGAWRALGTNACFPSHTLCWRFTQLPKQHSTVATLHPAAEDFRFVADFAAI
jgi:hypothetical protein